MTKPLRRAHLVIWRIVALLIPLLLFTGLAARRDTTPRNPRFNWSDLR